MPSYLKPISVSLSLLLLLAACGDGDDAGVAPPEEASDAGDAGVPEDSSRTDASFDAMGDPDLAGTAIRFCGDGETTGPYVQGILTHACAGGNTEIHSFVALYQCTGCTDPLNCEICLDPPESYVQLNLGTFDIDRTGETLDEENFFATHCQLGGGCVEPAAFEFVVEEHQPGTCIRGSYRIELAGGAVEEGVFDAGSRNSPTPEEIQACAEGG